MFTYSALHFARTIRSPGGGGNGNDGENKDNICALLLRIATINFDALSGKARTTIISTFQTWKVLNDERQRSLDSRIPDKKGGKRAKTKSSGWGSGRARHLFPYAFVY